LINLANRVQPLIRYDLGDRATVSPEACPCGQCHSNKERGRQKGDFLVKR
jgi:phenylacetate-CoA ligase